MTIKKIVGKMVPGVLALALTAGAVAPAGLTLAGVKDAFVATASAEETALRKIRFLGGALGDTITMKVIFCADEEVEYVTIKNPNTGNEDKFYQDNWKEYKDDTEYSNDYYIEMPVYPKNMATEMTFKMCDDAGNALHFGNSQAIMPDDYDYDEKTFSANSYLEQVRDSVMDGDSIKGNATDKEKATYDLSRALLNYGEWCAFYFKTGNEPSDGAYVEYEPGIGTPNYPTWWKNPDYWTELNLVGNAETLNDMLATYQQPTLDYGNKDHSGPEKLNHPYVVSLVLEEGVKVRVYVSANGYNPDVVLNNQHLAPHSTSQSFPGVTIVTERYFETEIIPFGNLHDTMNFMCYGYWDNVSSYDEHDTLTMTPIGYAKLVAIDKAQVMTAYEKSGLANTLRAMVTVESAAGRYKSIN